MPESLNRRKITGKKFYVQFTNFLYKKGCHDNYVGHNIKHLRTFFNYLTNDKDFSTGDFQKLFYVRKEQIPILVLNPEQLKFLIHDKNFHQRLNHNQKRIKEIFVFGCTTGLRFSDLFKLTNKEFEILDGIHYVKIKSQKTKSYSYIRLPDYAVDIYKQHRKRSMKRPVFETISLLNFNKNLKKIGELAGWTNTVFKARELLVRRLFNIKMEQSKKIGFAI